MTNIIEGGPYCDRDDCCVMTSNTTTVLPESGLTTNCENSNTVAPKDAQITLNKHCSSCGKMWTQTTQEGFIVSWNFK